MDHPRRRRYSRAGFVAAIAAGLMVSAAAWWVSRSLAPAPKVTSAVPTASSSASVAPARLSSGRVPAIPFHLPAGYAVHVFADGLGQARDLQYSPGGTLLVSNPDAGTVTALPDADHNGAADTAKVVLKAATVHGLAFRDGKLYTAETGRVARYAWDERTLTATFDKELFTLPTPGGNHARRSLAFGRDGTLYVSVGSTCNVCSEPDDRYATVMAAGPNGENPHIYARGLRNAPFLAINPGTGDLWSTEMGRDNLGDNTPPDEIDIVRSGADYGWPRCYGNRVHDTDFNPGPDTCGSTLPPVYPVPAHNAPLGLAFIDSPQFGADRGNLVVAYHGSWNRTVPDGYKVVILTVSGNTVTGSRDLLTGFISGRDVLARPVDVTFDSAGNLYVSDDKAGTVYIVQATGSK
jgi:glucose/arabinose dehydrogenase